MATTGPLTGMQTTDPNTGLAQDLGNRYVSKSYLLDVYPNLVPGLTRPGLWACGYNGYGALGNGNTAYYSSPIQVGSLTNWKQVAIGSYAAGTLGIGMGVKTDGTLWEWGATADSGATSYSSPVQVGSLTNWKSVSVADCGSYQAIKTDGTLWACGYNTYGELGKGNMVSYYSSPVQVGSLTNWKQVSAGNNCFLAVMTDGTLWAWGSNAWGQLGINLPRTSTSYYSSPIQVGSLTNWKQVSCGNTHTLAIKTDGTLWGMGDSGQGELGMIVASNYYSSPIQIGSLTNWKDVSAGFHVSHAVKTDGTRWAWGQGQSGERGDNAHAGSIFSPIQVGTLTNWKSVVCGYKNALAIKTDGTLWGWGQNLYGQLGLGTNNVLLSSPIQVGSLTTWKSIGTNGASSTQSTLLICDGYI